MALSDTDRQIATTPGMEKGTATRRAAREEPAFSYDAEALWRWAASRTRKLQDQGADRARVIHRLVRLMADGESFKEAAQLVAQQADATVRTLQNWYYGTGGRPGARHFAPQDQAAALIPGWTGRSSAKIPPEAWDWFVGYYLTRRQPTMAESYRRTVETARAQGWGRLPSRQTFARRLKRDTSLKTRVYLREGPEAVVKLYPPQQRDKRAFAAGEAVSGDGLKFDKLWVCWPDGEILNTSTGWFWQDLATGYLLAHRLAKTETTDLFRLATYDLTEICAPRLAWVDNTRVAASKVMTGGAAGRRRWRDRPSDPVGLLQQIGIEVRFTNPSKITGNPGAKPIERAFGIGGIHEKVATHPRFLKRGYSRKTAVPYEEFASVVAEEMVRYNRQPKRRTAACRGLLSFEQAFRESFDSSIPRKLTQTQRGLLLRIPSVVRADRRSGELRLRVAPGALGVQRYWSEICTELKGRLVTLYYDPDDLTAPVSLTDMSGRYLGEAQHQASVGFTDTAAAREHARNKTRFVKASRKAGQAQRRMSELEVAAQYPTAEEAPLPPAPAVVAGHFERMAAVGGSNPEPPSDDLISAGDEMILRMAEKVLPPEERGELVTLEERLHLEADQLRSEIRQLESIEGWDDKFRSGVVYGTKLQLRKVEVQLEILRELSPVTRRNGGGR